MIFEQQPEGGKPCSIHLIFVIKTENTKCVLYSIYCGLEILRKQRINFLFLNTLFVWKLQTLYINKILHKSLNELGSNILLYIFFCFWFRIPWTKNLQHFLYWWGFLTANAINFLINLWFLSELFYLYIYFISVLNCFSNLIFKKKKEK